MSSPEPTDDSQDTGEGQVPSASPGYSTPPPEGLPDAEDQGGATAE